MSLRKICIVVLSRANYGSIKSMIKALSKDKNFKLQIITGGSALLSKYGNVDNVIAKDGFKIPKDLNWFSLYTKKEFIPTFTKKIFKQVENLY